MNVNIFKNVKFSDGGTTHRYTAGVHDVPQAVGNILVKAGLAEQVKGETTKPAKPAEQPKPNKDDKGVKDEK